MNITIESAGILAFNIYATAMPSIPGIDTSGPLHLVLVAELCIFRPVHRSLRRNLPSGHWLNKRRGARSHHGVVIDYENWIRQGFRLEERLGAVYRSLGFCRLQL